MHSLSHQKLIRKGRLRAHFELSRNKKGMSLASILIMSVIMSMFLSSMYAGLMPVYRKVANLRYANTVRNINEAALDYVLDQFNRGGMNIPTSTTTISIPSSVTGDSNAQSSVVIAPVGQPPTNSVLYDANRPAGVTFLTMTSSTSRGGLTKNLRVLLEPIIQTPSTNKYAMIGVSRVEFVGKAGINSYNSPDPMQYCDIATLGAGNQVGNGDVSRGVTQGGNQFEFPGSTSAFNQAVAATCQTYNASPVSQATWAQIMGNIYSNGDDRPANSGYWPRSQNGANDWNNVFGTANGTVDESGKGVPSGVKDTSQSGSGSGNSASSKPIPSYSQWGNPGDVANPFNPQNPYTGAYVNSFGNYPQPAIVPADSAPIGSINLGTISMSGTGQLKIVPGATPPTGPIGSIGNGQTVTIPPGDYQITTLNMTGTSSIAVDPAASNTRLFLNPPSTSGQNNAAPALSFGNTTNVNMSGISGDGFTMNGTTGYGPTPNAGTPQLAIDKANPPKETAGSANQLQILTNANCTMVTAGNCRAVINAPNATVNIGAQSGLTRDANFYGSVIGGVARVLSSYTSGPAAFMHYDANLARTKKSDGSLNPLQFNDPWAAANSSTTTQSGYRAVTWQEF